MSDRHGTRDNHAQERTRTGLTGRLAHAAAAALALTAAHASASAADFYAGKTVTIIVGNDAGSAYDNYARLLQRYMPKYIPGKPAIIVQNMNGAGSTIAAQHLYAIAPKDGLTFGIVFPGAITEPLTEPSKYRYDPTRFEYLGTADSGTRVCFTTAGSNVKTFADAKQRKVTLAATGVGSSSYDYPYFFNAIAGSKFEVVTGYPGPGSLVLALERGEADGVCTLDASTLGSLRPDWFTDGKVNILFQAGLQPSPALTKLGIPSMWDFIPEQDRPLAELFVSQQVFQRPFVAPPGTPEAPIAILRAAFLSAFKDPDLLAEAATMKLEVNPQGGAEVEALVKKMYASPKELVARMGRAMRP